MNGWHKFGGGAVEGWNVEDGVLIGLGEASTNDIVTDAEFEDFELTVDWAIAPKAESGIFFNVIEQGFLQASDSGPEYQLIDDRGWPEKLPRTQLTGASYGMVPPARRATKYAGDWNRSRLVVKDGKVEHFLNGVKVVQYELGSPEWKKPLEEWRARRDSNPRPAASKARQRDQSTQPTP